MSRTVKIQLTEPQREFMSLTCRYPAFVGGYGSGKTQMMCISAVMDALKSPEAIVAIYEPTYGLVRDIAAPAMERTLQMFGIDYVYNKTDKHITTKSKQCGDFMFGTMDEPDKIVGYSIYRAHIDELDTLPISKAEEVWKKIIARARQKIGKNSYNRVSVYTTPEGFRFVHKRWVSLQSEYYQIVQASTYSNPWLPEEYIKSLEDAYPEELVCAYIKGEFVNLTSGTVYKNYDRSTCSSPENVNGAEALFVGLDFNMQKMAATIAVKRDRAYCVVDEIVDAYNTPAVIEILKARYPSNRIIIYPDSSGKNRSTKGGASESDIALLQQEKYECRFKSTNPRVKDRVLAVNKAFTDKQVFVNEKKCPRLVECLEQQAYDRNGEPDKTTGLDHILDAFGYHISYELPIHKPAVNIPVVFS